MKMRRTLCLAVLGLLVVSATSCKDKKERGIDDLDHALFMLDDRHNAENRLIEEQSVIRAQLQENYKSANSDGMRNKIQKRIQMIDISIQKARKNIANQDTIILQLEQKRDSILQMENTSN